MAIFSTKIDAHWNYFLLLEEDLGRLSRFIDLDEHNPHCFSVEIARLLIAAAAEVDVVCKRICRQLKPSSLADNIHNYREEIVPTYSAITRFEVLAPPYGLRLKPWDNWQNEGVPLWGPHTTKSNTIAMQNITKRTSETY